VILGLVLCALVLALAYPLQEWLSQREQIARTRAAVAAAQQSVAALTKQKAELSEPGYIENQARLRLHETFPGQQIYQIIRPPVATVRREGQLDRASVTNSPTAPWYTRLWSSDVAAGA
jgi:hypothetical protein